MVLGPDMVWRWMAAVKAYRDRKLRLKQWRDEHSPAVNEGLLESTLFPDLDSEVTGD